MVSIYIKLPLPVSTNAEHKKKARSESPARLVLRWDANDVSTAYPISYVIFQFQPISSNRSMSHKSTIMIMILRRIESSCIVTLQGWCLKVKHMSIANDLAMIKHDCIIFIHSCSQFLLYGLNMNHTLYEVSTQNCLCRYHLRSNISIDRLHSYRLFERCKQLVLVKILTNKDQFALNMGGCIVFMNKAILNIVEVLDTLDDQSFAFFCYILGWLDNAFETQHSDFIIVVLQSRPLLLP